MKFSFTNLGSMFGLALVTAIILSLFFIAIPRTEQFLPNLTYNLQEKKQPWTKTFTFDLDSPSEDELRLTKSILKARLHKFRVENFTIKEGTKTRKVDSDTIKKQIDKALSNQSIEQLIEESNNKSLNDDNGGNSSDFKSTKNDIPETYSIPLYVTIESTHDENHIITLLTSSGELELLVRKPDVNFDDPKNPYASVMQSNYDSTGITSENFRSIATKKILDSNENMSYFLIPKTWPIGKNHDKVQDFVMAHSGETIGISISGFVRPTKIKPGNESLLTVWMSPDPLEAKLYRIILNEKPLPIKLSIKRSEAAETKDNTEKTDKIEKGHSHSIDYINVTIAFAIITLLSAILFYTATPTRKQFMKSSTYFLTVGVVLSGWVTVSKLFSIKTDLMVLAILAWILNTILAVIIFSRDSKKTILTIISAIIMFLFISYFVGNSTTYLFLQTLLILTAVGAILQIGLYQYINKLKSYLK